MHTKDETAVFSAELPSLHTMLEWVRVRLMKTPLSDEEIRRIEVALEEALVNIISYAYKDKTGTLEIQYQVCLEAGIQLTIKDQGVPFNPLLQKKKNASHIPIEEMREGGLGIVLMQKLMDRVEYTRVKESNVLTMEKNFNA